MKTLSVIIPNYNHAKYLPVALEAIITQSLPPDEIILVDDASTDDSIALVRAYQKQFPSLKLFQNEKNLGPVGTINRAISLSSGKYLIFAAADDCVLPGFFEAAVPFMRKHPEVYLCTANSRSFGEDGTYIDSFFPELGNQERVIYPEELVQILRKTSFCIPTQSTIYRREEVIKYGCLNPDLKMLSDFFLNYRMAFRAPIGYIPRNLASFRLLEGSYCAHLLRKKEERKKTFSRLIEAIEQEPPSVRSHFVHSALVGNYGSQMISFLLKSPRFWGYLESIARCKLGKILLEKAKRITLKKIAGRLRKAIT